MKFSKYIIAAGCLATVGLTSCNDWLDVNVDPDSPNNKSALVENRLPWIQRWFMYEHGIVNMRTSVNVGALYSTTGSLGGGDWEFGAGSTTTPYQSFFVGCGANLPDLYNKAKEGGETHYMAVADIIHAYGFMDMLDLYGEMPYTEALGSSAVPSYDNGKTIFNGCIAKLDEAIDLLSKPQAPGTTPLSKGDLVNGGDSKKWLKLAYGLKARYLLRLSKKADLFDPQAILECLENGPQRNEDNSMLTCYNAGNDVTDYLMGDPVMTNGNWNYAAYGNGQRMTKYHLDLLENMRGARVRDPRFNALVPQTMTNVVIGADGKVASNDWAYSKGVDVINDADGRLAAGGAFSISTPTWADTDVDITYTIGDATARAKFVADAKKSHAVKEEGDKVTVTYAKGAIYVNSTNYVLAGDTAIVNMRSNSMQTRGLDPKGICWDLNHNGARSAGVAGSTGSLKMLPMSDFELLTYSECCFIKAEVLFRTNKKDLALQAYKDGIRADMKYIQAKCQEYQNAGYDNPMMKPMTNDEIEAYLSSAAVAQSEGDLKMSDIMLQKYVALDCSSEIYADMRRFNYSAGNVGGFGVVYPGMDRPKMFTGQAVLTGSSKTDVKYWPRRWRLPGTLELTYNETQALAGNAHCLDVDIWCYPVWWDCATDAEYESYLK